MKKVQKTLKEGKTSELAYQLISDAKKYRKFREEVHTMLCLIPMMDDCACNIDNMFANILDKGVREALKNVLKASNVLMDRVMRSKVLPVSQDEFMSMTIASIGLKERLTAIVNYCNNDMIKAMDETLNSFMTEEKDKEIDENIEKLIKEKYGDIIDAKNGVIDASAYIQETRKI